MTTVPVFDGTKVIPVELSPDSGVNVDEEIIMAQVEANIRLGLPQAAPHQENSETVALVCGGPSLNSTADELREMWWRGAKIVTVNNTYNWCIERNMRPSATIMLDARAFNKRFVERPVPDCRYLLASQCHPDSFELCRGRMLMIWHALSCGEPEVKLLEDFYFKHCHPVTLGTTVGLRAISLMRMLGFMRFEIFGLDSCWMDEQHHAYRQSENDDEPVFPIWTRPEGRDDLARRFICSPWMVQQAKDFLELTKERGNLFQLNVHGPGLIATMIKTGAQLDEIKEA